jgi:hypothetical protein
MTSPQTIPWPKAYGFTFTRVLPAIAVFALSAMLGAFTGRATIGLIRSARGITSPELLGYFAFVGAAYLIFRVGRRPTSKERPVLSLRLCAVLAATCLVAGLVIGGTIGATAV